MLTKWGVFCFCLGQGQGVAPGFELKTKPPTTEHAQPAACVSPCLPGTPLKRLLLTVNHRIFLLY